MVFTVTLTPALDKTVILPDFHIDKVNRIESLRLDPGGKGINVSKVLKELGTPSLALGILGGAAGQTIQEALASLEVDSDFVHIPHETRTNLKIIDPILHTNTDINEPGSVVNQEILKAVQASFLDRLTKDDTVVLAGKPPPGAPVTLYEEWGNDCRNAGARVFLDADGEPMLHGLKARPFLIKPNLEELERVAGKALRTGDDIISFCRSLIEAGISYIVVSLGKDGAYFISRDTVFYGHGLSVPVGSTVGAGDSMMAAMVYGFAAGLTFAETAALSIAVSAASVMCSGSQAPALSLIESLKNQVKLDLI